MSLLSSLGTYVLDLDPQTHAFSEKTTRHQNGVVCPGHFEGKEALTQRGYLGVIIIAPWSIDDIRVENGLREN